MTIIITERNDLIDLLPEVQLPTHPAKMASLKSQFGGIFLILMLGTCYQSTRAMRILLLPFPYTSHARQFSVIGDDLVNNGHEVYMVLTSSFPDLHRFKGGKVRSTNRY